MDFVSALARLLTDRTLRDRHREDPEAVADALDCMGYDADKLIALDPAQIAEQADGLIRKRYHEVRALLPETMAHLGGRATRLFFEFAENHWPDGHRRHQEDALAFCRSLVIAGHCREAKFEQNLLRFQLKRKRFGLHLVRTPDGPSRLTIQFLRRLGNAVRQTRCRLI